MLEKILKIENIKQWQHKGGLNQSFNKLNLIYGRNGSGKSTLCKLFESINLKDKLSIEALQPIESQGKQNLLLKFNSYNLSLDNLQSISPFRVFNQAFIDNNLYISNSKDRKQLSNYYDFSLGYLSVEKEKEIDYLKSQNETLTAQITPITNRILTRFPSKTLIQIQDIKAIADTDNKLETLKAQLQDIKSSEHLKKRKNLSLLILDKPNLDTDIFTISIEALSKEAEEKVNQHITYNLKEQDKQWIELGTNLVTESNQCPFCAQSLASSPIFHLYQEFINESYLTASSSFELSSSKFELDVNKIGVKIEKLEQVIRLNKEIIREWSDRIDEISLDFNFTELSRLSTNLELEAYRLVKDKKRDLLSTIDLTKFNEIFNQIFNDLDFIDYNNKVNNFNNVIRTFLDGLAKDTNLAIQCKINEIEEAKLRFTPEIIKDLSDIKTLNSSKNKNTIKIKELRDKIAEEQEESIRTHKDSINEILQSFHSMIRIKELAKDNKGKGGSTRLKYVITFINSELSALDERHHHHIFEHILSLGDRSALALSFFLSRFSKFNNDKSIIVLDDPMSSLDRYRKDATIVQIAKLIENNYQTFVFSHDPFFLSDIYKYSILSKKTNCFEIEVSYKDLDPLKPDSTKYISSKMIDRDNYNSYVLHSYHKEYNKLYDFISNGSEADKVEIARSIRPILEAYLRFLYPKDFSNGMWLGEMISKIRQETNQSSIFYDKHGKFSTIEKINEFSKTYHHAESFDTKIQDLDFSTVQYYAKDTLRFITGL